MVHPRPALVVEALDHDSNDHGLTADLSPSSRGHQTAPSEGSPGVAEPKAPHSRSLSCGSAPQLRRNIHRLAQLALAIALLITGKLGLEALPGANAAVVDARMALFGGTRPMEADADPNDVTLLQENQVQ
jgi:hypothetical protein